MCDNPFLLHHTRLPFCCPCQGTVGNGATMDSPEPSPLAFKEAVLVVGEASLDLDCSHSDCQLHHFLAVQPWTGNLMSVLQLLHLQNGSHVVQGL